MLTSSVFSGCIITVHNSLGVFMDSASLIVLVQSYTLWASLLLLIVGSLGKIFVRKITNIREYEREQMFNQLHLFSAFGWLFMGVPAWVITEFFSHVELSVFQRTMYEDTLFFLEFRDKVTILTLVISCYTLMQMSFVEQDLYNSLRRR